METRVQKVVFMRHGVARHNLLDPVTGKSPNLKDPRLLDPPLVYQGKQQALDAGERLRNWWRTAHPGEIVELVVTSPLTRCIQTATLAFLPGDCYTSDQGLEPSFLCTERCREAFGMHYPDKRRETSLLRKQWPHLSFDPSMEESDFAWKEDSRETVKALQDRIIGFLHFLSGCHESNIVVVTHGVWIEVCLNLLCPQALDNGKRRVYNCDMFAIDCTSKDGTFRQLDNPHKI